MVKVSSGFAQNFLFPHHKAQLATPGNLKAFESEKARRASEEAGRLERSRALAGKLKEMPLTLEVNAGEGDKLYGAVNSQDIVESLRRQGIDLERKEVHLEEPIHRLGAYRVAVKLHPQVSVQLQLQVVRKK